VGVWTEVDWYYVGSAVLFLATLLAAGMDLRVMHGLRHRDAPAWFWLVCAFCLSVKVVIWAVSRIAALLQVLQTMPQATACSTRQPTSAAAPEQALPPSFYQPALHPPTRA